MVDIPLSITSPPCALFLPSFSVFPLYLTQSFCCFLSTDLSKESFFFNFLGSLSIHYVVFEDSQNGYYLDIRSIFLPRLSCQPRSLVFFVARSFQNWSKVLPSTQIAPSNAYHLFPRFHRSQHLNHLASASGTYSNDRLLRCLSSASSWLHVGWIISRVFSPMVKSVSTFARSPFATDFLFFLPFLIL